MADTQFKNFVNRELPKRIWIETPPSGNLPKGKILKTSGIGLGVEIVDDDPLKPETMVVLNQPGGAPIYMNKIVEVIGEDDAALTTIIPTIKLFSSDSTNIPLGLLINALNTEGTETVNGATYVVGGQLCIILQKGRTAIPQATLDLTGANPGQYVYCDGDGNLTLLENDFIIGQVLSASNQSIFVNIGGGATSESTMNGGVWISGVTAIGGSIGGVSYLNNDAEYGIISGFQTDANAVRLNILANSGHSLYKPKVYVKTANNISGTLVDLDRSSSSNFEWLGTIDVDITNTTEIIVQHNDGPKYVCSVEILDKPIIDSFAVYSMPKFTNIFTDSLETQTQVKAGDTLGIRFRLTSDHHIVKAKFGVGTNGLGNNDILNATEVVVDYTGPQSQIIISGLTVKNYGIVTGSYKSYMQVQDSNGIWSNPIELAETLIYNNLGVNISSSISYAKVGNTAIGVYDNLLHSDLARVDTSISDLPNGMNFAYKFSLLTGSVYNYKNMLQYYQGNTPVTIPAGEITPEGGTSHGSLDYNIGLNGNYSILNFNEPVGRLTIQRKDNGKVTNHDFIIKIATVTPSITGITKPVRMRVPDSNVCTRGTNSNGNPIPIYTGPEEAKQYAIVVTANQPLKNAPDLLFDANNINGVSFITSWATTDNIHWSRTVAITHETDIGTFNFRLGNNLENLAGLTGNTIDGAQYKIGGFAERNIYVAPWSGEILPVAIRTKVSDITKLLVVNESSTDDPNANVFHAAMQGQNVETFRSENLPWEDGDYTLCNGVKIYDSNSLTHWFNLRIGNASSNTTGFFVRIEESI